MITTVHLTNKEARIRLFFRVSIFAKGAFSLIEVGCGILALFIPVSAVSDYLIYLAQGELFDDPNNLISTHIIAFAHQFSYASGTFIALYLLSRGLIKLFLIIALLKDKLWAYPSSLALLSIFVLYQIREIWMTHSIPLIALTIFDFFVMWFIWREYQVVSEAHKNALHLRETMEK